MAAQTIVFGNLTFWLKIFFDWLELMNRQAVFSLLFFTFCLLFTGCHSLQPTGSVRVAVLDGTITYEVDPKGDQLDEGWWFGSKDRYLSPNPGTIMGDSLARELGDVAGVDLYSRQDLEIYLAQKERLLRRSYPDLEPIERKEWLAKQSPLDYGKSLNVDYVVSSQVHQADTVTNRTFSWWYSVIDARVEVWSVETGEKVAQWDWKICRAFDSQLAIVEKCSRRAKKRAVKEDVFNLYLSQ